MIDFTSAFRGSRLEKPELGFEPTMTSKLPADENFDYGVQYDEGEDILVDRAANAYQHLTDLFEARDLEDLNDENLVMLPYRVYGYALLDRTWCMW